MQNAGQLIPLEVQFLDNLGNPLAFGYVYTAQAGTTPGPGQASPLATYTDATAATQQANPVVLDARGCATIWLNGYYAVAVYDLNGVLIRTRDNVTTFSQSSIISLIQQYDGNYGVDTGIANAYVVALSPPLTGYVNGQTVSFRPLNSNTGGSTINAGGGVVPLLSDFGLALTTGQVQGSRVIDCVYDVTAGGFLVKNPFNATIGAWNYSMNNLVQDIKFLSWLVGSESTLGYISNGSGGTSTLNTAAFWADVAAMGASALVTTNGVAVTVANLIGKGVCTNLILPGVNAASNTVTATITVDGGTPQVVAFTAVNTTDRFITGVADQPYTTAGNVNLTIEGGLAHRINYIANTITINSPNQMLGKAPCLAFNTSLNIQMQASVVGGSSYRNYCGAVYFLHP